MTDLAYVLGRRSGRGTRSPEPASGIVTRSDDAGVWVTPVGNDTASPLGPMRGATRPVLAVESGVAVLRREKLPVGLSVLYVNVSGGPWVVAADTPVSL